MSLVTLFKRQPQPVVYEVSLEVDRDIIPAFDEWLSGHVREMLTFPGFESAVVYARRDADESRRDLRVVTYEVRNRRELDSYLHTHAPRMRKEGVERFGAQFAASRRILPAGDYAVPDGMNVLLDREQISGGLPVCGNCHQPVPGRFCMHCGQEDRAVILSLRELFSDLIGSLFNYDSRFFQTMRKLLFQPGLVTVEYVRGRRQQYLPPVRMYIFASLIFFLVAAPLAERSIDEDMKANAPADAQATDDELTPEQRADVDRRLREAERELGLAEGTLGFPDTAGGDDTIDDDEVNIDGLGSAELEERLERGIRAVRDDPKGFMLAVIQEIPTVMLLFLPVMAMVLKLFYITTGRYYVEHLVFTLHFHSAVFVLLLLWLLFGQLESAWPPLQHASGWVTTALWLYLAWYLYKSMRRVYGQGRFLTTVKYVMLLFTYFIAATTTFVLTLVYTLFNQS